MNSEKLEIEVRENPYEDHAIFYMRSAKGYLTSRIDLNSQEYEVIDYYVYQDYRRQGFGKELLRFSIDHAKSIGARAITGTNIVSRESLDVVVSLLGIENVNIENLGDYTPIGKDDSDTNRTKASLRYDLKISNNKF